MRKERRGFERARHVVRSRRRDVRGSLEDRVERVEEELEGRNSVAEEAVEGCWAFNRLRRR